MEALHQNGHSATIDAFLVVGEQRLKVKRVGGGMLMVATPVSIPPATPATIVVSVDGHASSLAVVLDDGISPNSEEIMYSLK